ncbi:MAG: hypothetical protein Sylvanvirus8_15 [Sylvanvirus sp.]|uniref:Protein kinase domain-containing protein n=1 Tax=Sylvanvirus sp. TaxID=2487774 RepID=A0A3G5ALC0_9VIRU|nr:MAG: hypothetical protein Sylvanvirus8_15 [Sylvanvirus sp.]
METKNTKHIHILNDPQANDTLFGEYQLEPTCLGKGTTGDVFVCTHIPSQQQYAVKRIDKRNINGVDHFKSHCDMEIHSLQTLKHPHIVKFHEIIDSSIYLYVVMEYLMGGELYYYIVAEGGLSIPKSLSLLKQLVTALIYCHSVFIAHRDLKLENIMFSDTRYETVKLVDFGHSTQLNTQASLAHTSCGSPHYASPQIVRGEDYDPLVSDVWSLGVVFYAMMTGNLPFDHSNSTTLMKMICQGEFVIPPYIPASICDLLHKMICVVPGQRIRMEDILNHSAFESLSATVDEYDEYFFESFNESYNQRFGKMKQDKDKFNKFNKRAKTKRGDRINVKINDKIIVRPLMYENKDMSTVSTISKMNYECECTSCACATRSMPEPKNEGNTAQDSSYFEKVKIMSRKNIINDMDKNTKRLNTLNTNTFHTNGFNACIKSCVIS